MMRARAMQEYIDYEERGFEPYDSGYYVDFKTSYGADADTGGPDR